MDAETWRVFESDVVMNSRKGKEEVTDDAQANGGKQRRRGGPAPEFGTRLTLAQAENLTPEAQCANERFIAIKALHNGGDISPSDRQYYECLAEGVKTCEECQQIVN